MTSQQIEKNETPEQISCQRWQESLSREGRIAQNDPLPSWLDAPRRPAIMAPRSVLCAGLLKAGARIDAGVLKLEAGLSVALRKTTAGLVALFVLALATGVAAHDLVRGDRQAMDRLKDDGIHLWQMIVEA